MKQEEVSVRARIEKKIGREGEGREGGRGEGGTEGGTEGGRGEERRGEGQEGRVGRERERERREEKRGAQGAGSWHARPKRGRDSDGVTRTESDSDGE